MTRTFASTLAAACIACLVVGASTVTTTAAPEPIKLAAILSTSGPSAPLGVPVGAELLGLDYTEAKLLAYAYAFEQASGLRKLPKSTPPLPHEP